MDKQQAVLRIGFFLVLLVFSTQSHSNSTCYGSTSAGRLQQSCKLPASGGNYTTYSSVLRMAGRTYVHCDVSKIMREAYGSLEASHPEKVFVYAETGKKDGGPFKPHKTHQNGLSVDFMVPVLNGEGKSVPLPTSVLNRYGYDIDFTLDGKFEDLTIDYEAFAAHLAALKKSSDERGVGIWRVLFDPKMQHELKKTKAWPDISDINFTKRRSWVRHDDHYHIDFVIPCEPL